MLGMRFENPKQLKHMLCNYAVANGYQQCFKKNDSRRLLINVVMEPVHLGFRGHG